MEVSVHTLNAFTKGSEGGNPAGVVLKSDFLTEEKMQMIAKKIGFSETAFIQTSQHADYKIRYFTQTNEVNLCGHATIASFHLLLSKKMIKEATYTIETGAGILKVHIANSKIYLSQTLPKYFDIIDKEEIVRSLHIHSNDLDKQLPIQIVSTGLRDIIIPIKKKSILNTIHPDFNLIKQISKKYNVDGYHLFTLDSNDALTAHCRNFAPIHNINEESATGTSTGALTCYLHKHNKLPITTKPFVFEQGFAMGTPSEIVSTLKINKQNEIDMIEVGGMATYVNVKHMTI
ncbi:PhzF family phenazine biosynthesis protein [Bacillus solimangrovi]|uniref:Phenazine biosynthesis protein PhzF n=1 Tax=Bacillus solimangrovi TaxID=1305675 RepID=A0A1E5LJM6_9BACI|nr:PhzF family phenazine biosynthesis protein [Bacillus solimangrovi]OEH94236.1 phenazine biosynthesis protein PhzF [Bacillus solimangrovi]